MRIGFDAKRAFFNRSGLGNYSRTLVSQLCMMFPENDYFLFSPRKSGFNEMFPPGNSHTVFPLGFPYKQIPSYWRSFRMGKDIANLDISIFHGLSNELPADILKSGAKSVVTIHDLIFMRYPELYQKADRAIYRKKFSNSCKMADAVIAISEQTRSDIIDFLDINPEKIHVIYQGCNPSYYTPANEEQKKSVRLKYSLPPEYMLYVGTIEERKNLIQLVKAKHEYKISLPLVVIGRPTPYFENVKAYIEKNKVTDVLFLKDISQAEIPVIYQEAELFVYPSSFEGFGIPILEALNSGTPVIAGRGSCMEETGGAHSLYVEPSDTGDIALTIKKVLENPELKTKMIEEGYRQALLFRDDRTANEVMKLYKKLL